MRVTETWRLRLAVVALMLVTTGPGCGRNADRRRPVGQRAVARAAREQILTGRQQFSQHKEELIIRHFFGDWRGGFFLDVGCARPRADNNTYYLEDYLGWSGIAVDALGEYAPLWRKKRPRSEFFNFFVSDHSDDVTPFYRSELPGLSSYLRQAVDRGTPEGARLKFTQIRVPTITLTRLLEANGVSKIDLLSMDIEGAEPLALAGFDIDRFRPELVCVEVKPPVRGQIQRYFDSHGYVRLSQYDAYDLVNYYYAPKTPASSRR
jgi:FkbM family methyltransferase